MKVKNIFKSVSLKTKVMASVCALSIALGSTLVLDKNNAEIIKEEQSLISEMTNKTLNISFVPNNPNMKNDVNLFSPINDNDIENIGRLQGVKSVKPINSDFNPLNGYAKINNQSSYIELYGMDEKGDDLNKDNIEMLYGRAINTNDVGKNVVVLNMETVNSMQIADARSLIGTGLEINGAIYEVIGIMNVVNIDARDNTNELQYSSLIPKSTSKEVVSRANSSVGIYSSITVQLEEGYNVNAIESSIYNILYGNHENINGYYERDSEYSLPKKLGPTLMILDNFLKLSNLLTYGLIILSFVSLVKVFSVFNNKKDVKNEEELEVANEEEKEDEEEDNKVDETTSEDVDNSKENTDSLEKSNTLKDILIKNISVLVIGLVTSCLLASYYLLDRDMNSLFNISILSKLLVLFISIYLMTLKEKITEE